jgi:uncharacterized membrane protein
MAFCPKCGAPVEGSFCGQCGTALGAPAGPGGATPPPAATTAGMADNVAGTLCYVLGFITGILFLVLEPYNRNKKVRFHAFQSIFLSVAWFGFWIVLQIVFSILMAMSWAMFSLVSGLSMLVGLAFFVLWLYLLWKTYQDQKVVLPVVGPLAEKQA